MSYIALATTTLSSAASSVTFSSIPTSVNGVALRDLILVVSGSLTSGGAFGAVRFNSDTANYSGVQMLGNGSSAISSTMFTDRIVVGEIYTERGVFTLQVMDYNATDKHKTTLTRANSANNNVIAIASSWASTSAINTMQFYVNTSTITAGSTISLYGIAG